MRKGASATFSRAGAEHSGPSTCSWSNGTRTRRAPLPNSPVVLRLLAWQLSADASGILRFERCTQLTRPSACADQPHTSCAPYGQPRKEPWPNDCIGRRAVCRGRRGLDRSRRGVRESTGTPPRRQRRVRSARPSGVSSNAYREARDRRQVRRTARDLAEDEPTVDGSKVVIDSLVLDEPFGTGVDADRRTPRRRQAHRGCRRREPPTIRTQVVLLAMSRGSSPRSTSSSCPSTSTLTSFSRSRCRDSITASSGLTRTWLRTASDRLSTKRRARVAPPGGSAARWLRPRRRRRRPRVG